MSSAQNSTSAANSANSASTAAARASVASKIQAWVNSRGPAYILPNGVTVERKLSPHPKDWTPVLAAFPEGEDPFTLQAWLRENCSYAYDILPDRWSNILTVFFENDQDAMLFKLSWGGDA